MLQDKKIIAIIPARGGSKSIPKKNIVDLGGFPLIAYSIAVAKLSNIISRVIVSTDSEEIAQVARKYGAEVPFMRPAEFAADTSGDFEVFKHAIEWLKENENYEPEYLVHLRPTTPLRESELIDKGIEDIIRHPEATSLRSGHELRESPHKCFALENGFFVGLFPEDKRPDYANLPRQAFPAAYQPDGYVDVVKRKTIMEDGIFHGSKILGFISPDTGELDRPEDLEFIKFNLNKGHYKIYDYLKNNFN
ncbi:MAG: acylneuraminate cytidylyltransferase family protein [Candidatus Azambacteria bacterium]|nr:acylneuraminate cytidylyltransferase family protein [Candidatus Azambacteria bacterium]